MIQDTLRNKSGNPERLNKWSQQLESSSANVHVVGEDLLRVFTSCFVNDFVFIVITETTLCSKDFTRSFTEFFISK